MPLSLPQIRRAIEALVGTTIHGPQGSSWPCIAIRPFQARDPHWNGTDALILVAKGPLHTREHQLLVPVLMDLLVHAEETQAETTGEVWVNDALVALGIPFIPGSSSSDTYYAAVLRHLRSGTTESEG
ncbi:MAG: hypothetical protein RLZZ127_507 [Planctomycetota bacterium]|jgi:hypothetical protein